MVGIGDKNLIRGNPAMPKVAWNKVDDDFFGWQGGMQRPGSLLGSVLDDG